MDFTARLPEELVLEVFSALSPRELCIVSLVSREWRRLSYDFLIWKRLYRREFGIYHVCNSQVPSSLSASADVSWKERFSEANRFFNTRTLSEFTGGCFCALLTKVGDIYVCGHGNSSLMHLRMNTDGWEPKKRLILKCFRDLSFDRHEFSLVLESGEGSCRDRLRLAVELLEAQIRRWEAFLEIDHPSHDFLSSEYKAWVARRAEFETFINELKRRNPELEEVQPDLEPIDVKFVQVSVRRRHFGAISEDGELFTWGGSSLHSVSFLTFFSEGGDGKLGTGHNFDVDHPRRVFVPGVDTQPRFVYVSTGWIHSVALTVDGDVYAFGSNQGGALGISGVLLSYFPRKVERLSRIDEICCGGFCTLAKNRKGEVFLSGTVVLTDVGIRYGIDDASRPKKVDLPPIRTIAAGLYHFGAVTPSGRLFMWGAGEMGKLGLGGWDDVDQPTEVKAPFCVRALSLGSQHSGCVSSDGIAYTWGAEQEGRLGIGEVMSEHESGGVNTPRRVEALSGTTIVAISCGVASTLFVDSKGTVHGTGRTQQGRLGVEREDPIWSPMVVSRDLVIRSTVVLPLRVR